MNTKENMSGEEIGKILYFDPNNVKIKGDPGDNLTAIFNGLELINDPEDYSIAVDLEVTRKSRDNITTNDKKMKYSMEKSSGVSNFLQGKTIGNENTLSTFFTDITYDNNDHDSTSESMCINSIDIEFTAWYVASVIIKFTDVRGAALFSPSEYSDSTKTVNDSLFSGFFTMPYPIFKLKIKGFYGDAVTYPLHCQDFKAEFNAEKGNFDVTVQFIGYTYAMLSDIQMTYLIAAPYSEMYGKSYWDDQINKGRFLTLEGSPLPKIPELIKKVKQGGYLISTLSASDENFKSAESLEKKASILSEIKKLIDDYIKQLDLNYNLVRSSDIYHITNISTTGNTLSTTMSNDVNAGPYIEKLFRLINQYINTYADDTIFLKYKGELARQYFQIKNIKKVNKTTSGNLDLSEIVNKIDLYQKNAINKKKDVDEQNETTKQNTLNETYQMVPSIYNFTKLLLAHMETLLHCVGACANEANKEQETRGMATGGQGTDLINNKFSPFPWFTINDDGKDRDEWIGLYHPDFSEVKLIKSLIKAKTEITSELEKLETQIPTSNIAENNTTLTIGDVWFPINAFDNSISSIGGKSSKPYSNLIKENGVEIEELKSILSTRIATIVGLSASIDLKNYNSYILGESKNIIDQLGSNAEHIGKVITALNEIKNLTDENNKKNTSTLKYYIKEDNGKRLKTGYEYSFLNTGILPFSDGSIATHNKTIKNGKINSNLKYYYDGFSDIHINTKYIESNIITGTENCDMIYKSWYSTLLLNINEETNLNGMVSRLMLNKELSSGCFSDINYDKQPLLNRISYNSPIIQVGKNDETLRSFYNYCGVTPYRIAAGSGDFSKLPNMFKCFIEKDNETEVNNAKIKRLDQNSIILNGKADVNVFNYPIIGGNFILKKEGSPWWNFWNKRKDTNINTVTCLFGNPVYYAQNEFKKSDGKTIDEKRIRKAKAFLFLQTLSVDFGMLNSLFDGTILTRSFMSRVPKVVLLLLGSMLWRKKNTRYAVSGGGMITIPDENKFMKDSNGNFKLSNENNDTFADCDLINKIEIDSITGKELISFFENWTNNSSDSDGWIKIQNLFEIKKKDGSLYHKDDFIEFTKKCHSSLDLVKTLTENTNDNIFKKYSVYVPDGYDYMINLVNKDKSDGVKAVLELLFNECILSYTGNGQLVPIKRDGIAISDTTLKENNVNYIITGIITKLNDVNKHINNVTEKINVDTNKSVNSLNITEEQNTNLQAYKYIKTLYDKWVSGYEFNTDESEYKWISSEKTEVNGFNTYDLINFKFLDRSYTNIGNKFIIDLENILENMIGLTEQKTLYTTLTDIYSKNNFLFIPMPNYQSWTNASDFAKIFQPMSYSESKMTETSDDFTSIFICLYTGSPSKNLNIQSNEYEYKNDALNLKIDEPEDIPEDFTTIKENLIDSTDATMNRVPVFTISYGKQNQSYFKNITLNQNNPVTTEASILAIKNLNDKNDKSSAVTTMSQDMYNIYSSYSYTCQVEMLGCPQIQPMMYFQLANSPMWNGAYMIYKVNHSIRPGNMTTSFVGMRMGKIYPLLIKPTVVSAGDFGFGMNISPKNNKISNLSFDTKIGKYFTLKNYTTTDFNLKNGHVGEIPEYIVSRLQNNLAPTVDSICDSWNVSELNKGYGKLRITSGYRLKDPNKDNNSQHVQGLAADLQLIKNSKVGNDALFEHIKTRMKRGLKMDQLIKEYSDGGGWCHVSPVYTDNSIVKISGEVLIYDKTNTNVIAHEIIEEAKSSGKICDYQSPNIKWFNYWKKAENGIKKGWRSGEQKWYAHESAEHGDPTIAYGIKLSPGFLVSNEMKLMNLSQLQDGIIGISESTAEIEIAAKVNAALKDIKKVINSRFTSSTFDKIQEKYVYGLVDIYMNYGSGSFRKDKWKPFIIAATNNNLNDMLNNCDRYNAQRTKLFKEYLQS